MSVTPNKVLIDLRHEKGESQAQVAKNIGISQSMLAMLEAGYRKGSDDTKIKIANYYGESVDTIFFEEALNGKNCISNSGSNRNADCID